VLPANDEALSLQLAADPSDAVERQLRVDQIDRPRQGEVALAGI
jgi:hypothetical protein